jgi:hypothetical protein
LPSRRLALATITLVLAGCNFESGHAVFRGEPLGPFDTRLGTSTFEFTARGRNTIFTLVSAQEPVLSADSRVDLEIKGGDGKIVAASSNKASELDVSNWDEPKVSIVLSKQSIQPALREGVRYQLRVTIFPPPDHVVSVAHHWVQDHSE